MLEATRLTARAIHATYSEHEKEHAREQAENAALRGEIAEMLRVMQEAADADCTEQYEKELVGLHAENAALRTMLGIAVEKGSVDPAAAEQDAAAARPVLNPASPRGGAGSALRS